MLYLFDIDGTLIGGDGAGRRAFDRACREALGVDGALDGFRLDGMTDPLILAYVFERHVGRAPTGEESRAILAAYVQHLADELARASMHVKPAVAETLDRLAARGAVVGLATGNLLDGARLKLERHGLWARFPFGGFGSDAADRAQLVRVAIERGCTRLAREPTRAETWVIGDTPRDIEAAHAAGASAVGVATGSHSLAELRAAGAEAVYPTMREWLATL